MRRRWHESLQSRLITLVLVCHAVGRRAILTGRERSAMWAMFRCNCVFCATAVTADAADSERGESACLTWNEEGGDGDSEEI